MTNTTANQDRLEAAAASLGAKLQAFQAALTTDELALLQVALSQLVAQATEDGADTSGYLGMMPLSLVAQTVAAWNHAELIRELTRDPRYR